METIVVDIISGDWKIETANVQLQDGKIVAVELHGNYYKTINPTTAEVQRAFWVEEYKRLGWVSSNEQMIAKAIGMELIAHNDVHEPEDSWIDAAFEDRYENAGF